MNDSNQTVGGNGGYLHDSMTSTRSTAENISEAVQWYGDRLINPRLEIHEVTTDPIGDIPQKKGHSIDMDKLYPADLPLPISRSMVLLRKCIEDAEQAIEYLEASESIFADDAMLRLKSRLPELFCLRTIGDGFGGIVSAMQNVYRNLGANPLTISQIRILKRILVELRNSPRMSFETAMEHMTLMEDAGLMIDPPEFEQFLEELNV